MLIYWLTISSDDECHDINKCDIGLHLRYMACLFAASISSTVSENTFLLSHNDNNATQTQIPITTSPNPFIPPNLIASIFASNVTKNSHSA